MKRIRICLCVMCVLVCVVIFVDKEYLVKMEHETAENQSNGETAEIETSGVLKMEEHSPAEEYKRSEKIEESSSEETVVADIENASESVTEPIVEPIIEPETQAFLFEEWDIEPDTKYAKTSVNIRSLPTKDSDKLGTLKLSQDVKVTGDTDKGWYRVEYKDKTGYVSSKYLLGEKPVTETENVAAAVPQAALPENFRICNGVSSKTLKQVEKEWNTLPQKMRDSVTESGSIVEVRPEKFLQVEGYSNVVAATYRQESPIRIALTNTATHVRNGFCHEVAHLIDEINGYPSYSEEFIAIYNEEKNTFVDMDRGIADSNSISAPDELFAETARQALYFSENIKVCAPKAYEFVCRYIY